MKPLPTENQRTVELLALGELLNDYDGQRLALETIRTRGTTRDFMTRIADSVKRQDLTSSADRLLGLDSGREMEGYSLGRAMRAAMNNDWSQAGLERDISDLASTRSGAVPIGFYVPFKMLAGARDFNAGTPGEAGYMIGSGIHAERAPDPMRKVMRLAELGATILPGLKVTTELPRFESTDAAEWKSEVAAAPAILTQTAKAILTPKRVACTAVLSRQALLQSTPELDAALGRQLSKALWEQVEDAALNGDGLSDNPTGVRHTTGIGSVVGGTDGATLTYQHLVDLEYAPAAADVTETEASGFLVNAATRKYLRTKARAANLPFIWENGARPLLGYRAAVSNLMLADLDKGSSTGVCSSLLYSANWAELFLGVYGPGVDLTVDRVTLADVGKVRITAAVYVGAAVNLPEAFASMDDALLA